MSHYEMSLSFHLWQHVESPPHPPRLNMALEILTGSVEEPDNICTSFRKTAFSSSPSRILIFPPFLIATTAVGKILHKFACQFFENVLSNLNETLHWIWSMCPKVIMQLKDTVYSTLMWGYSIKIKILVQLLNCPPSKSLSLIMSNVFLLLPLLS